MGAAADIPSLEIVLVAEQRSTYLQLGYSDEDCAALTHDGEVRAVSNTLKQLGHHVTHVSGVQSLVQQLAVGNYRNWDLVFNMAQGFHGTARESQVPALLEAYQIPYTFADAATMALCQNKANTKIILRHHHIPTAPFWVIPAKGLTLSFSELTTQLPSYPLFLKPVTEGSSKGVADFNKVTGPSGLEMALQRFSAKLPGQNILIESFLPGREYTVSILGTGSTSRVIGIREFIWQSPSDRNGDHIALDFASRKSKSSTSNRLVCDDPHDMTDPQIRAACQVALAAWRVLGCRDAGRVDLRFDSHEPHAVPNVLEVNPVSGLLPGHSPLPGSAESNGISFEQLLAGIIESALQRSKEEKETHGYWAS
ncbi:D-ala D-ala ligase [Aspergillus sclerotialis]|uniref:D-ala D-ala ligase n=1 Tax=Aspergillus sclerotialis TaxID=2070753 RepID=A0A3A2Z6T3_9EURO|nr:D-ala D-ala ligase [Aspergillus sclerotialis]